MVTLFGGGSLSATVVDPLDPTQFIRLPIRLALPMRQHCDLKMHLDDAWTFVNGEDKISNFIPSLILSATVVGQQLLP